MADSEQIIKVEANGAGEKTVDGGGDRSVSTDDSKLPADCADSKEEITDQNTTDDSPPTTLQSKIIRQVEVPLMLQ